MSSLHGDAKFTGRKLNIIQICLLLALNEVRLGQHTHTGGSGGWKSEFLGTHIRGKVGDEGVVVVFGKEGGLWCGYRLHL